jgi:hypothetical protein
VAEDRVEEPAALVAAIGAALSGPDRACRELAPVDDLDVEGRMALVRSFGRKAGRRLGVKVQDVTADHRGVLRSGGISIAMGREDGGRKVQVIIVGSRDGADEPVSVRVEALRHGSGWPG